MAVAEVVSLWGETSACESRRDGEAYSAYSEEGPTHGLGTSAEDIEAWETTPCG